MKRFYQFGVFCLVLVFLQGCSTGNKHKDLYAFMEKAKKNPGGEIEPLPTYGGYKTFSYGAMALRSPFNAPIPLVDGVEVASKTSVKPDNNRQKEYLEEFNFAEFSLVGTVYKDDTLWSLVKFRDKRGKVSIDRVTIGRYLGKNHGKIVASSASALEVVEIVPDGKGGWLERPRTLTLANRD